MALTLKPSEQLRKEIQSQILKPYRPAKCQILATPVVTPKIL
jgi:hypothetical protein